MALLQSRHACTFSLCVVLLLNFPNVLSAPCSYSGVVDLVFNRDKPDLFVEMKPSNDLTFLHKLKTGAKLSVKISLC
jgi:hypothetical protein